jgi:transposase-like protein
MQRKKFTPEIKAKVALEAIKGVKTANEIAGEFTCHSTQVSQWKRALLDGVAQVFENGKGRQGKSDEAEKEELYRQIGELQVQLAWMKICSASIGKNAKSSLICRKTLSFRL